jgi:hypothetical protein
LSEHKHYKLKVAFVQNLLDNSCQIGNKILGAGELLCSELVKKTDNLEILVSPISDVAYTALMEQVQTFTYFFLEE